MRFYGHARQCHNIPGEIAAKMPEATAEAIWLTEATVVFVDSDPRTNGIDPSKIETAITSNEYRQWRQARIPARFAESRRNPQGSKTRPALQVRLRVSGRAYSCYIVGRFRTGGGTGACARPGRPAKW